MDTSIRGLKMFQNLTLTYRSSANWIITNIGSEHLRVNSYFWIYGFSKIFHTQEVSFSLFSIFVKVRFHIIRTLSHKELYHGVINAIMKWLLWHSVSPKSTRTANELPTDVIILLADFQTCFTKLIQNCYLRLQYAAALSLLA